MATNKEEKMRPYLIWHEKERAEVDSLQELELLIEELTQEAIEEKMPFSFQLMVNPETCFSMVVGREISHLEFYSTIQSPLAVGCRGPWDDEELIELTHGGQFSEMPKCYWVPLVEAQEALKQYFRTGERPLNIKWE